MICLLQVLDHDEAPTQIHLDTSIVKENAIPGSVIGRLSTVDEDKEQTHQYTLQLDKASEGKTAFNLVIK